MTSVFGSGPSLDAPKGDVARQATAALRGYGYQLYASGLAWLGLGDGEILHLEVAEDYAVATRDALAGTQVKDTGGSANITLQSAGVRAAIDSFFDLVHRNPKRAVSFHYLTTSEIGVERSKAHRIAGGAALHYWRRAAAGADVGPLRTLVAALDLEPSTKAHLEALTDDHAFRSDFLRRIHWDCGAPGIAGMRDELEAGLIEYVASARRLSSHTGRAVLPAVVERLLMTAVTGNARQLRRADLLVLIDETAIVAVPLQQLSAALQGGGTGATFTRPALLVPASDLPLPAIRAPRIDLVAALDTARRTAGVAIASGATGLGKSLAARVVADCCEGRWSIVDFRNLSPAETAARLSLLRGELAATSATHLILDDVNEIDDPAVRDALLRVVTSLRRRDCTAVITSYRAPTKATHYQLAPEAPSAVEVAYLAEEEVTELVALAGGDTNYAGAVYRAAARGHPQLTMAALLHLKSANWSRASIGAVLGGQIPDELGAERRAARQRLIAAFPTDAQTLLLRASLIRGGFDRGLALEIAGLEPIVPLPGLLLDQLVGPWIEPYRTKRLRVSPLLEDAAEDVLTSAECRAVHRRIADAMFRARSISVLDAPAAMHHALRSEEGGFVFAFAHSVITCPVEVLDFLAPFLGELMAFATDTPIFPQDLAASAMLRLAQLLVLLPYGTPGNARAAWDAFERERFHVTGPELIEGFTLSKLLLHPRTGELFSDWLEILLRFDRLLGISPQLATANSNFKSVAGDPHVSGVLFGAQLGNVRTVARFKEILERLDNEEPATRDRVLSSFQPGRGDISILVNHGWLKESRTHTFDWEAAARDYAACADLAISWGNAMLATRCAIARAICLDENGDDAERALACLAQAEGKFGFDIAISRARAKIHWLRRDHAAALPLLTAAAEAGGQDTIERAYIAREAGISAATLGDWAAAQQWFERAQGEASTLDKMPSVRAMAIGLLADTAHAAYCAGRPEIAIVKMRDALSALPGIDPEGTLAEAHCHRVVRHGLLWLYREITGTKAGAQEEVIYSPGCASNTEPLEAIREHPVVALDVAFYLLADADEALAAPTGFYRDFRDYLVEGPIVSSELSAAIAEDRRTIATHDPTDFVQRVRRHASVAEMVASGEWLETDAALKNPRRGTIPLATIREDADEDLRRAAEDYLLSFATAAALAGAFDAIDAVVHEGLASSEIGALHSLLRRMRGDLTIIATDRDGAANTIWLLREDLTARPAEFCWASAWLLFHVNASRLRLGVEEPLVAWIFGGCAYLVSNGRFRLSFPATTVPPVEAVLARPERTIASAAELLLTLAPAVATRFIPQARSTLEKIAGTSPK
ncbi:hypothetical protein NKL07_33465 [Mesorhizobium sp. C280B]|uniref:hypothetical protein n=1 Tax=unclassified Mesorhizobium TaxID=325217 RepID=UPI0003CF56FA|nr:hypothetical protein [Mesorhizobium sp. LSJC280B00]ESW77795.1 hypothetical protein X772_30260 [Mesorhizobium sp. LSJC280B00]